MTKSLALAAFLIGQIAEERQTPFEETALLLP